MTACVIFINEKLPDHHCPLLSVRVTLSLCSYCMWDSNSAFQNKMSLSSSTSSLNLSFFICAKEVVCCQLKVAIPGSAVFLWIDMLNSYACISLSFSALLWHLICQGLCWRWEFIMNKNEKDLDQALLVLTANYALSD